MNAMEKDNLLIEAKMQMTALRRINAWKKLAIIVSTIGVAIAYAGMSGTPSHLFPGILGIFLTMSGFILAAIMNLGLKNGRRNVDKMLDMIEGGRRT